MRHTSTRSLAGSPRARGALRVGRRFVAVLIAFACVAAACSFADRPADRPMDRPADRTDSPQLTPEQAELAYGKAPVRDPAITLQPDVVLVEGGAKVIRHASANGLEWTIDRKAPGADDLSVGKVMFLTSRAVGRVATIEESGNEVTVGLLPAGLTDIIKDGRIEATAPLDLGNRSFLHVPDAPGAIARDSELHPELEPTQTAEPEPTATTSGSGPRRAALPQRLAKLDGPSLPPPARGDTFQLSVGAWDVELAGNASAVSLRAAYGHEKMKVSVGTTITLNNPHLITNLIIADGKLDPVSTMVLEGVVGFAVNTSMGTEAKGVATPKWRLEIPVDLAVGEIVVFGLPLIMTVKLKFLAEPAFTAANTFMKASGKWAVNGAMGIQAGKLVTPTVTDVTDMIDTIQGQSLGVSAIVFAMETRFLVGFGFAALHGGSYAKMITSVGITYGSDAGAPLYKCRAYTLVVQTGMGFGIGASSAAKDVLDRFFPGQSAWKTDNEIERMFTVINRVRYKPENAKACNPAE